MRVVQRGGGKGSLKWIQRLVNARPDLAASELRSLVGGEGPVEWLSPLTSDGFAEYRDGSALKLLGVSTHERALSDFWPVRGPQWDALARVGDAPVLVEAKAHVAELFSGECRAKGEKSRLQIERALKETKNWLEAQPGLDWMRRFYQYTNRLAHLYFLREVNGLDAHLVFLYFLGDGQMGGPRSRKEWEVATEVLHEALGIRGRRIPGLHHLYVEVGELESATGRVEDR